MSNSRPKKRVREERSGSGRWGERGRDSSEEKGAGGLNLSLFTTHDTSIIIDAIKVGETDSWRHVVVEVL